MASLQLQAEAVRNAVASTASCSPTTVVSLKSLLLSRDTDPKSQTTTATTAATVAKGSRDAPSRANSSTTSSSRPGTAASRRRPTEAKPKTKPESAPQLSDKEKAQLATHVINACLKALAEAAKPSPSPPPPPPPVAVSAPSELRPTSSAVEEEQPHPQGLSRGGGGAGAGTARAGLERCASAPMAPLQPRTLNRVATSPVKSARPAAKEAATGGGFASTGPMHSQNPNYAPCLATVECARVAFQTLRTLQEGGQVTLPELQLEAGMSSFVAKLLALGMVDQACRELRIVKRRLQDLVSGAGATAEMVAASAASSSEGVMAAPAKPTRTARGAEKPANAVGAPASAADNSSSASISASDLFDFGDLSGSSTTTTATTMTAWRLIVASQLQALRILAALKKPALVESSLSFLRRSCRSSPLQLLIRCVKATASNAQEQAKALRQMETLSQLLLTLAPGVASRDDAQSVEPSLHVGPAAAFELQALGLETRLRCWVLSKHTAGDVDKDILTPFSRCLATYARRSRLAAAKTLSYSLCRRAFDHLQELIQLLASSAPVARDSKASTASIYQTLGLVARETSQADEAVHWARELRGLLDDAQDSAAKHCSVAALLLSLQLKSPSKQAQQGQSTLALLSEVLEAMKGSLKGDTAELEDLLANICLARKAAVTRLLSSRQGKEHGEKGSRVNVVDKISDSERKLLESFIYQCPHFCLRWLGKPPAAKSSTKDFLRYEHRRQLLSQSIRHTLDSAFVVAKTLIEDGRMVWDQLDAVLDTSLTVLEYLGDLKMADPAQSYYVKISHFYYMSYHALRRGNQADAEALKSLRRAIDCVKQRPSAEREKAHLIPKLERMAELCKSMGQVGDALGALQSMRTSLVDDGVLAQVTTALTRQPPLRAWAHSDTAETLSRTLVAISRLEQVHLDWTYDLTEPERAAVLEHRLYVIYLAGSTAKDASQRQQQQQRLHLTHPSVEALLKIYYPTQHPVRRLRTLLRLFSVNMDSPDVLADITPQVQAALGLMESQGFADDASLAGYQAHYKALAASLDGFANGYPDISVLEKSLASWQALTAAHPTRLELEQAIDDIAHLQTHLQSVADYLRAVGRDSLLTTVLELSSNLCRVSSSAAPKPENDRENCESGGDGDGSDIQLQLTQDTILASHYVRMGNRPRAEQILGQVGTYLQPPMLFRVSSEAHISFHLASAEHFIAVGRLDEANQHLTEARLLGADDSAQAQQTYKIDEQRRRRLGAQVSLLHSMLALENGDTFVALQNARNGVRVLFKDWTRLEKAMGDASSRANKEDDSIGDSTENVSSQAAAATPAAVAAAANQGADFVASLHAQIDTESRPEVSLVSALEPSTASKTAASPEFWSLFHPLFNSMQRLSTIYAHLGMFQETVYYAEQARKIALVTGAALTLSQAEAWLGTVWYRAGQLDKAMEFANLSRSRLSDVDQTYSKAVLACELGGLYREMNAPQGEQDMIAEAEKIVQQLSADATKTITSSSQPASDDMASIDELAEPDETVTSRTKKTRSAVVASTARRTRAAAAVSAPTRATRGRKAAATVAPKTPRKRGTAAPSSTNTSTAEVVIASVPSKHLAAPRDKSVVLGLQTVIQAQKALSLLAKKEWVAALAALRAGAAEGAIMGSRTRAEILVERVALAACLLGHGTEQMARDAVFSVVQDSTLSFPAVSIAGGGTTALAERMGRLSLTQKTAPSVVASTTAVAKSRAAAKSIPVFVDLLQEAQDYLIEAQAMAAVSGDASMLHRISSMLQSAVIYLSATSWNVPRAMGHPGYASCSVELARNMAWWREQRALLAEKAEKDEKTRPKLIEADVEVISQLMASSALSDADGGAPVAAADIGQFQRDYIDIIPQDWTVISLALTENNHDLCITKLQAGQSPFVIRLPLDRAVSRDADNEVFDFQQGRAELLEVIAATNASCHDARDMTVKGAKAAWWAEREELDGRMKDLVSNVEQIWLGGFRGVFSPHIPQPDLFARFQKTFQGILDKHLPSRRTVRGKRGGGAGGGRAGGNKGSAAAGASQGPGRIALDPRTLGLFIGLGDATEENCDFEDALNDLLYFVVDILQFHGEHNAYDEIDFDSMVVETVDALYTYHSAARERDNSSGSGSGRRSAEIASAADRAHTILVLDKALHVFPWEALPCMQGSAVSRVPSLACLRRLVLDQRPRRQTPTAVSECAAEPPAERQEPSGHIASATCGAYMLNPSGDLRTTEARFDGVLSSGLSGAWTRIVGRPPTETEFEEVLNNKDVLLYFGHGSGAQYIRGRTVRKLARCRATALLMGCSSAGLAYNGEFELHGPVWDYMLAGCPAVVGTLWDVTDKEIDRFAGRTFEEWGLLPGGQGGPKGKGRAETPTAPATLSASLVEAVTRARDAPRFRYITAAAVCVYGIPVYLA